MQNREEFRQKRHARSEKNDMSQEGENFIFGRGGMNSAFGPKYRPWTDIRKQEKILHNYKYRR